MLLAEATLGRVLDELRAGGGFAEVFAQSSWFTHIALEDRNVITANRGFFAGAGLRVIRDGACRFACVSSLDDTALLEAARGMADVGSGGGEAVSSVFRPSAPSNPLAPAESPSEFPLLGKTSLLLSAQEAAFSEDGRVSAYSGLCKDATSEILVANSEGVLASETRCHTTFYQQVTVREGPKERMGTEVLTAELASDLSVTKRHEDDAREAARSALAHLDARSSPSGVLTVLFGPGAAGPLLHEAVGHAFEGDFVLQGRSPYGRRLGQRIAEPCLTLEEGVPAQGRQRIPECDDEGTPAGRALLVEEGVLKGFLTDRATSAALGLPLTGHASRESYRFPPMPRTRRLVVRPGPAEPGELIRSLGFGLYVLRTSGGPVDAPGGEFSVQVARGFVVREGRLAEPIFGATLVGTGPDLLASVDGVANDPGASSGICVKEGQTVSVSESVPTLRVSKLTVRGC